MVKTLRDVVPNPDEVTAMSASELARILVEIGGIRINESCLVDKIKQREEIGGTVLRSWGYGQEHEERVQAAVTTALQWLNDSLAELMSTRR